MDSPPPPKAVFKIFRLSEWATFDTAGSFAGSKDDLRDGFIHLSCEDQVPGTLAAHFAGESEVIIAAVSTVGIPVIMEASRSGHLFPHLYAPLPRSQVLSVERRRLGG